MLPSTLQLATLAVHKAVKELQGGTASRAQRQDGKNDGWAPLKA